MNTQPDPYTCPHGQISERLGDCEECNQEIAARPDPTTMTGEERAAELRALMTEPAHHRFADIHKRAEALVGRPVWTHEFALPDLLIEEAHTWQRSEDYAETAMDRASLLHKGSVVVVTADSKTKGDHGEPE